MSVEVFRYTPEKRGDVEPLFGWLGQLVQGQDNALLNAFLDKTLGDPEAGNHAILVACQGSNGALAMIVRRPVFGGDGRIVMYLVPQDDKGPGPQLGRALKAAADDFLAGIGVGRQMVSFGPTNVIVREMCADTGLVPVMPYHRLKWSSDGAPFDVPPVAGVTLAPYEGGDHGVNEGIAKVWKSAFRSDPLEPVLTSEVLEEFVRGQGGWFMVAREDDGGRVVGLSEAGPENYYSGIAVARAYWGKSLADALALATCNEFVARGHNELTSMVRTTNRASLALHERMGWEIYQDGMMYGTPAPEGDADKTA